MRDELPDHESETYEHIPWSRLIVKTGGADRGRWMYVAAGLLVVAVVAAVMGRIMWKPEPAVAASTTIPAPAMLLVDTPMTTNALYSEADLMAVLPPVDLEHAVAAAARRYLRTWVASENASWAYVEWDIVESIEELGEGLFRVRLLMQLLHRNGEETVRLPEEGVEILVRANGEEISIADLPSPTAAIPIAIAIPSIDSSEIPAVVQTAALESVGPWGTGTVVSGGMSEGRWRIELLVETAGSLSRKVAVWLTSDGERTTPVR